MGIVYVSGDFQWTWHSADGKCTQRSHTHFLHHKKADDRNAWCVRRRVVSSVTDSYDLFDVQVQGYCIDNFMSLDKAEEFMRDMWCFHLAFKPLFDQFHKLIQHHNMFFPPFMRAEGEAMMAKRNAWIAQQKKNIAAAMLKVRASESVIALFVIAPEKCKRYVDGDARIIRRVLDMLSPNSDTTRTE